MQPKAIVLFVISCFFLISTEIKAQRIATFGTNTLFESMDNPAVGVLNKDCKTFAFNFLIPTISSDLRVWGDADSLRRNNVLNKSQSIYNIPTLPNPEKFNTGLSSYAVNIISAKYLLDVRTGTELMLDVSSRGYAFGEIKNDAISTLNYQNLGPGSFPDQYLTNSHGIAYNQISVGIRRKLNENIALGVKLGYASGINYTDVNITNSQMDIQESVDNPSENRLYLSLTGRNKLLGKTDSLTANHFLPNFKNPGFNASVGMVAELDETMDVRVNIRDLGFITWKDVNREKVFDGRRYINGTFVSEYSADTLRELLTYNDTTITDNKFTTSLPARLEAGLNARVLPYWRSAIFASVPLKNLQSDIALLNDFNYKEYHFILLAQYNTNKAFTVGTHFMIQAKLVDFIVGSDNLFGTYKLVKDARNKTDYDYTSRTSAQFNFGVAFKLGKCYYSENATYIPMSTSKPDRKARKRVKRTKDFERQ